jgi:NMD protein affecting ribosome stability and mRNA decay
MSCNVKRVLINAYEVSFNFSLENEAAFKVIQELLSKQKEHDKNATIYATIRYIG